MERIDFQVNEEDKRDIVKRTYKFAIRILYIVNKLPKNVVTYRIIDQLVGCGTSMGSNTEEASAGFSKSDFTFKMSIASKEARETNYFLRLLRDSGLIKEDCLFNEIVDAIDESNQIKRILAAVVKTSQAKTRAKKSRNQ
jgi:four helix bundle protein